MLERFFKKIKNAFTRDHIIFPEMGRPVRAKTGSLKIVKVKASKDVGELRESLKTSAAVLINIKELPIGLERKSFAKRLKVFCKQFDKKVYGVDKNWLLVTKYKVETD
ncbi:MAG: hypothetical protein GOV01_02365 [Candidatus Altiarchaeota archaeon]|nr:hypothetical protein [Candidatus Altiarchaeota archaeon]